mmetsp:Transcript_18192/g.41766  ORF Transcript_18192/g.41766 Transcript_18192/m.41766 type:complete len:96 (+) Transcript_18192:2452-2739(+)
MRLTGTAAMPDNIFDSSNLMIGDSFRRVAPPGTHVTKNPPICTRQIEGELFITSSSLGVRVYPEFILEHFGIRESLLALFPSAFFAISKIGLIET